MEVNIDTDLLISIGAIVLLLPAPAFSQAPRPLSLVHLAPAYIKWNNLAMKKAAIVNRLRDRHTQIDQRHFAGK